MSEAEFISPTGTAEIIPPAAEELRITEADEIREFEDGVDEVIDR